jgi:hypothetical protein
MFTYAAVPAANVYSVPIHWVQTELGGMGATILLANWLGLDSLLRGTAGVSVV